MTSEEFDEMVVARTEKIKTTLASKAEEYAVDGDRFHNFKVAARIKAESPEESLHGMMVKHEVSVMDLIEMADSEPTRITEALVDAKIGDFINYLILLEGLLRQRCRQNQIEVFKKSFDSCSKTPDEG